MAIAEYKTGTATIGVTEYSLVNNSTTLASDATDGIYQVMLDMAAMAATEEYVVTVKEKVTSAGTQRIIYSANMVGVQSAPVWVSPSLILMHGWDVSVRRLAGTDRSISWSIRQVA